ncbi:MAG: SulP family inorganic anion transporter [Alphaproteobacteria bacterium]|nr:SulP family inorganic anion transporter [Alphaproteobacteria bacterium]NCQ67166.1 SulP family inorganic anion transporter [Alphaproteobacteria bacterium]NCT07011.1 SulP family inorganic anion transporter [Alphaproteobacteria bacterium]
MNLKTSKIEILSGLTVALALVPEAVAFSFVAGVQPLVGLYAAFIICLITSVFGGRPGMISGATGALAVVMVSLVSQHGVQYLFATVVLMGVIQLLAGIFRLGKFIRIVPYPVMLGFVNGLAIVIFLAQLGQFKTVNAAGESTWLQGSDLYIMLGLIAITMGVIKFLPKITKMIPAPLAGIGIVFAVTYFLGIDTKSVGDMADISGGFPEFSIPQIPFTFESFKIIFPYALTLAGIGLIETLLALTLIDELTETQGRNSRECIAQGLGNVVTGFFGGMGGCAMIGQSMINISSGARRRLSGIAAALFLIFFIVVASPVIERIPIAALVGVMFMVVIGTFAWSSLRVMTKVPKIDAFIIVLVSAVTVAYDLAIAVLIGVIFSALSYVWQSAQHIYATITYDESKDLKTYKLRGPLFFGSIASFKELFTPKEDPEHNVIDFSESRVWDHSALEAIKVMAFKYKFLKKDLKLKGLSQDCIKLLDRKGITVICNKEKDPHYSVVVDHDLTAGH